MEERVAVWGRWRHSSYSLPVRLHEPRVTVWTLTFRACSSDTEISVRETLLAAFHHFSKLSPSRKKMSPSEPIPYPRGFQTSPSSQHTHCLTAPAWQPRPDAVRTRADRHQKGAVSGCGHEGYVYTSKTRTSKRVFTRHQTVHSFFNSKKYIF